jgi:hypothetical protein
MYVTDEEYVAYATLHSVTIPATEELRAVQLVAASEYIDAQEPYLKGTRSEYDQDYAYPRDDLCIDGYDYDDDSTPTLVEKVQMELAFEINAGIDLFAVTNNLPVIKERVEGAVEVQYATPAGVQDRGRYSKAMQLMKRLMKSTSMSIPLVRV